MLAWNSRGRQSRREGIGLGATLRWMMCSSTGEGWAQRKQNLTLKCIQGRLGEWSKWRLIEKRTSHLKASSLPHFSWLLPWGVWFQYCQVPCNYFPKRSWKSRFLYEIFRFLKYKKGQTKQTGRPYMTHRLPTATPSIEQKENKVKGRTWMNACIWSVREEESKRS